MGRETTSKWAFGMLWVSVCIRVQVHVCVCCVIMASLCMPQGAPSQLVHLPLPLQTGRTATPLSAPDWCHSWSPGIDDCGRWKIPRQRSADAITPSITAVSPPLLRPFLSATCYPTPPGRLLMAALCTQLPGFTALPVLGAHTTSLDGLGV